MSIDIVLAPKIIIYSKFVIMDIQPYCSCNKSVLYVLELGF